MISPTHPVMAFGMLKFHIQGELLPDFTNPDVVTHLAKGPPSFLTEQISLSGLEQTPHIIRDIVVGEALPLVPEPTLPELDLPDELVLEIEAYREVLDAICSIILGF